MATTQIVANEIRENHSLSTMDPKAFAYKTFDSEYVCEIREDLKNVTNEKGSHLIVSGKFRNQDRHWRLSAQSLDIKFVKLRMNSATLR